MAPAGGPSACSEVCAVRVVARFRPPVTDEERKEENPVFTVDSEGVIESADHLHVFRLDSAFGQETSQQKVYQEVGRPVVQDVLSGYNGTILAYGPTGSGKTFCMFGRPHGRSPPELEGLVPRAVEEVLQHVRESGGTTLLSCSFFEVYLEKVRDFLSPKMANPLKELPQHGVEGLSYKEISTAAEALLILRQGLRLRVAANTSLNEHSSRSHAIFSLLLRQTQKDGIRTCKLTLVDLAGSEKVRKSGSVGGMLEEAKKINSSLSALGHVIEALSERRPHVPYRDSRLTRLLEESLGGNCRTTLLVACSSSSIHAAETLSSLRFAVRAKKVENSVGVTVSSSSSHASQSSERQLERRIAQLRRELARLESRRAATRSPSADRHRSSRSSLTKSVSASSLSPERRAGKMPAVARGVKHIKAPHTALQFAESVAVRKEDVPEALPLPISNSAALLGSCRSTADPGSGMSSTCSVTAVSLTGSSAGTPLSRDREPHRDESPCPPNTRGSYSFLIEATPLPAQGLNGRQSLEPHCCDAVLFEAIQDVFEGRGMKARPIEPEGPCLGPPVAQISGRCRELERQLEAERRQHALELENLHQRHSEVRSQISPARRNTASGASRLAALAKTAACTGAITEGTAGTSRMGTSESARQPGKGDEAWPVAPAHTVPVSRTSCFAAVNCLPAASRTPRASPVLSQYLCGSPTTQLMPSVLEGTASQRAGSGSRLLMASAARGSWRIAGSSISPRQGLSCSPTPRRGQVLIGDSLQARSLEALRPHR
ncbi:unnamed protein product [Symbiodinium pilosum]|uniref:Kinesin motor domain-containing protein n=1 Tax=Symbiodinium pilosum TaxID=2952 RepID=A0A812X0H4_SYMPI|nr:unnamed protein product [Symbiodinium pilosum]